MHSDAHGWRGVPATLDIGAPAVASAVSVAIAGAVVLATHRLGPQSLHMALHIALMSVAAPLIAWQLSGRLAGRARPGVLWAATALQMLLLWTAHAPAVLQWGHEVPVAAAIVHVGLFLSASLFWCAIVALPSAERWHAIGALLVTGKLACLLGALLVFSPRVLATHGDHPVAASSALADQHLAGLLMIIACPLSYVVAGVIVATQLVRNSATSSAG